MNPSPSDKDRPPIRTIAVEAGVSEATKLLADQLRLTRQLKMSTKGGGGTYPNLFDAHPPFQIDGNFGATAGITAFRRPEPIPPRVDLKTGKMRILDVATFKGKGGPVKGGAATVLDLPLNKSKPLKSLTVRTLANEVVIGLMSATLAI